VCAVPTAVNGGSELLIFVRSRASVSARSYWTMTESGRTMRALRSRWSLCASLVS
jgi:hypothetical protein